MNGSGINQSTSSDAPVSWKGIMNIIDSAKLAEAIAQANIELGDVIRLERTLKDGTTLTLEGELDKVEKEAVTTNGVRTVVVSVKFRGWGYSSTQSLWDTDQVFLISRAI